MRRNIISLLIFLSLFFSAPSFADLNSFPTKQQTKQIAEVEEAEVKEKSGNKRVFYEVIHKGNVRGNGFYSTQGDTTQLELHIKIPYVEKIPVVRKIPCVEKVSPFKKVDYELFSDPPRRVYRQNNDSFVVEEGKDIIADIRSTIEQGPNHHSSLVDTLLLFVDGKFKKVVKRISEEESEEDGENKGEKYWKIRVSTLNSDGLGGGIMSTEFYISKDGDYPSKIIVEHKEGKFEAMYAGAEGL